MLKSEIGNSPDYDYNSVTHIANSNNCVITEEALLIKVWTLPFSKK